MAPDLTFILGGTAWYVDAHDPLAQLWFCLPFTLLMRWLLVSLVLPELAAAVYVSPSTQRWPQLVLALGPGAGTHRQRPSRLVVVFSAVVGSISHIMLDAFSHGHGWAVRQIAFLQTALFTLPPELSGRSLHMYDLLQFGGTAVGSLFTFWCIREFVRRRASAARVDPPDLDAAPIRRLFRTTFAAGLLGATLAVLVQHVGGPQHAIMRIAVVAAAGMLIGCWQLKCRRSVT